MVDYYDVVLGLIPLTVAVVTGGLVGVGFEVTLGASAGALLAVVLICHAMFVRSPVGSGSAGRSERQAAERTSAHTAD